jgi:hypothetical protein
MVLTLIIPAREWFGMKHLVTKHHLDNMCKVTLATASIVGYAYMTELFISWYSGWIFEQYAFLNRLFGPYAWAYWIMVSCNVIFPQLFWFKWARTNVMVIFVISIIVNIGMWFERYVIVVTSLSSDFLPSSWGPYFPTWVDLAMLAGSFGLFFTLFLLFLRFLPMMAMAEIKGVISQQRHEREKFAKVPTLEPTSTEGSA